MSLEQTIDRVLSARMPREDPPTPEALIARWQADVEALYRQIEAWMTPYIEAEKVTTAREILEIREEALGAYEIDLLDLDIGDETIRFRPRGTMVIGAFGRVDMIRLGSSDEPIILVLGGDQAQRIWQIVERLPKVKFWALTQQSFEIAMEKLLDDFGAQAQSIYR